MAQPVMAQPVMAQPVMAQPVMAQQPAPPPPVVIVQQAPQLERRPSDWLDAAQVSGCWFEMCCFIFPTCQTYNAVSPDSIAVGECGCCCFLPFHHWMFPVYQRCGPRHFEHPEGELVFSGPSTQEGEIALKLCDC